LAKKLPAILHPLSVVGIVAPYFVRRYGLSADCKVVVGSGDNPQTKVLIDGDLLSLGTSFVMMASTADGVVDSRGWANAMYDGLGRPFCFGCRTNGALVWDRVRSLYNMPTGDFSPVNKALETVTPGSVLRIWQPDRESFPLSSPCPLTRKDSLPVDFAHDYAAVVDSSLGLLYRYSRSFAGGSAGKTLYIAGGPTANPFIVKRIAAIWNSPVVVIGRAGAALGTAVAAAAAVSSETDRSALIAKACATAIGGAPAVQPDPELVEIYHKHDGYLDKLEAAFRSLF
jgi:xylulokinase